MKNKVIRHQQSPNNQRKKSTSFQKKHTNKNSNLIPNTHKTDVSSLIFQSARNSLCAGSPRIQDNNSEFIQKYKTYIQFISSGKVIPESRNSYNHLRSTTRNQVFGRPLSNVLSKKKGALTPTPKRNQYFQMTNQQGRRSSIDKHSEARLSNGFQQHQKQRIIKIHKQFDDKQNNFIVKGKIIKNSPHAKFMNTSNGSRSNSRREQLLKNQYQVKQANKLKKVKNDGKNPNSNRDAGTHKRKNSKNNITSNHQNSKSKKQKSSVNASLNNGNDMDNQQQELCQKLFKGIEFYRDLGKGAHALVRSAVDWNKKRKIAVKIYDKSELTNDQLKSIQRQIQILMKLSQQNIVKLYEIIETYKTINLLMQYGGGNSLEQYMRSRPQGYLSEDEARHIFTQVCRATAYLHQNSIAHRDLKTQNILLNKHLQLKIIDFGFSLQNKPGQTIASYCGTPTYMAPEVVSKTPHDPLLSDRWSLGILLFTMLNGHCPFKAPSQKQLFKKICSGEFDYIVNISDSAKWLIQSFLKKQPQQRLKPSQALQSKWIAGFQTISLSNPGSLQTSNKQRT